MMGYDQCNVHDYNNYFINCVMFEYDSVTGRVTPYRLTEVYGAGEEEGGDEELAVDSRAYLNEIGGEANASKEMDIETLINSMRWLTHRFQLGYVPINDKLVYVTGETTDRRMRKGTSLDNFEYQGILFAVNSAHVPDRMVERLVNIDHQQHAPYAVVLGICKVLEYGNVPCMRRNIDIEAAKRRSNADVTWLLAGGDGAPKVVVPSFDTAVIAHRSANGTATLLHSGTVLGHLSIGDDATVTLKVKGDNFTDRSLRSLAVDGVRELAVPMVADEVVVL